MTQQSVAQVTVPGTVLRNVGTVAYEVAPGAGRTTQSNEVTLAVEPLPTRSSIQLGRYQANSSTSFTAGPTQCRSSGGFVALAPPAPQGVGALDPTTPIPMQDTTVAHAGDPMFVRVVDLDRNRDGTTVETVDVKVTARATGDSEVLRLTETGPNTGVFVGYVPTALSTAANDCMLAVDRNSDVEATYVDPTDSTDASKADALVDPYGLVFDSQTGQAINGARVRLINVATGQPANVYGDDGVSRYPSEMVTGQVVTDQGGTQYSMPAGVYRFPMVAPGTYRLEVIPPGTYSFPAQRTIPDMQTLPNAPFRLQQASYGQSFTITVPAIAIDLPLDANNGVLLLRKSAGQQIATTGDFVQYTLTLQNTSTTGPVTNVQVNDHLPAGARFRAGSLRRDNSKVADPQVAADGSSFTFTQPRLEAGQSITLRYVLEYTIAMRGMKDAVNTAEAIAPGNVHSNTARALVRMNEELFSQKGFIVGRVFEGKCDADGREDPGVANVRIYLEDGRYGVTDENGHFHFDDLVPGTHTVQLDKLTLPDYLELAPCADRMGHAGRDYSQFAELHPGTLWRSDFAVRQKAAPKGDLEFEFHSSLPVDPQGDGLVAHDAVVHVNGVTAGNTRVMVMLPEGFDYVPGSATVDGKAVSDADDHAVGAGEVVVSAADGVFTARLGELAPGSVRSLHFTTRASANAGGTLSVRAMAVFDSPAKSGLRSPVIESQLTRGAARYASSQFTFTPRFDVLKTELETADEAALRSLIDSWRGARDISISAVGHTDSQKISARSRRVFADNYALSRARAQSVADYLANALNVPAARVHVDGRGSDQPVAIGRDDASLAKNRRVEIVIEGSRFEANAPMEVVSAGGKAEDIATQGMILRGPSTVAKRVTRSAASIDKLGMGVVLNVEALKPGIGWLAPAADATPAISVTKVAIQHLPGQKVLLTVNGQAADPLSFDGVDTNAANTVAMSRWRAVDLIDGENKLVARVLDKDGHEVWHGERAVHFGGQAVRAELDKAASKLVADGRSKPVIALRMFDKYGKPARAGTMAAFSVDSPYRSQWEVDQLNDNQILTGASRQPQVEVQQGGLALIELEPTTNTGNAVIRMRYSERQSEEFKVWLSPAARDWILVGIAEGTAAYNSISGNMETAAAADREEGLEKDGRMSFFAKGRIKGDFLLTMAYDSAREKKDTRDTINGAIEPDKYYLLYGDATEQRFEAASQSKLYLKIERRQFVALFGDFDTGFTVTELTKYNRSLSGVRTDYAGERISVSGFAARTDTGLVQDELLGDGTAGLYHLSRSPIVIGSDKLRIEVRDRFEITRVVETHELSKFVDYDLDYERGTVFFKQPVQSRDHNLNPVYIVVDYEVRSGGDDQTTGGVRVAAKFDDAKIEVGASAVYEGAQAGDTRIVGSDLQWRASDSTRVRAEVAQSQSDDPLRPDSSTAWLVEGKHVSEHLEARAWARQVDTGFGVGQQLTADTGTRSAGVDARYKLSEHFMTDGEIQHQQVLASDATRLLASAEVRMLQDTYTAGIGARHVADVDAKGQDRVSDQATLTGSVDLWDSRVTLRGEADTTLGGKDESVDYPARGILGVDYHWSGDTTLFAEYEHAEGAQLTADTTRFGVRTRPWERTQVNSSIDSQATEYGPRLFSNFGLTQGFVFRDRWAFDVGVDQSKTLRGPDLAPLNPNAPLASGTLTEDFFSSFLGASYHRELWQMTTRLEHRDSDTEDRWASTTGWYREPVEGHAMSVSLQAFDSDSSLSKSTSAVGRFAWAFRPDSSRWIVFDRFELKYDDQNGGPILNTGGSTVGTGAYQSSRAVNNLHANWQLGPSFQLGLQYGARYVSSTYEGDQYAGVSDIFGTDLRRQLTRRFDLGAHLSMLHSWSSHVEDYSSGIDVGMTVAKNVWVSVGYNFAGFRDDDFSASRHTAQGPYLSFRMKADQDTFKDLNLDSLRASR